MSRFGCGGLERVQVNLAQAFHKEGIEAKLVAGQVAPEADDWMPYTASVEEISSQGRILFIPKLLRTLLGQRPELVFTTSNDIACLMLILRIFMPYGGRVICTQHQSISGPRESARGAKRIKLEIIRLLMKWLLPRADGLIAVSRAVADDMSRELMLDRSAITVIHNPVVTPDYNNLMQEEIEWPWPDKGTPCVVFVGRLSAEKRLDLLLGSFELLVSTLNARLLILGAGPECDWLKDEIIRRGLTDRCMLIGFKANPLPWIRSCDLLVLASDYEGFGNVLVEAMACGVQVVSTNCPNGPAEILDNGKFGQLVPCGDMNALALAMQNSLTGAIMVPTDVLMHRADDFGVECAARDYLRIIREVV